MVPANWEMNGIVYHAGYEFDMDKFLEDASKFIGKNLKHAQFCRNMDTQIGMLGVPVYSAQHSRVYGIDEVTLDRRDSIAESMLKHDILRGRNPIDALIDFKTRSELEEIDR